MPVPTSAIFMGVSGYGGVPGGAARVDAPPSDAAQWDPIRTAPPVDPAGPRRSAPFVRPRRPAMSADEPDRDARAFRARLQARLHGADRVRVRVPDADDPDAPPEVLDVREPGALRELIEALADVRRADAGRPLPPGHLSFEFQSGGEVLARLALVRGRTVHWADHETPWARLADVAAERAGAWLAARDVPGPLADLRDTARREGLWDRIVADQRALLPAGAPDALWTPGDDAARIHLLEQLVPHRLDRAVACLRVLGAAHPEWFVGLPLDRLVEPYLHDRMDRVTVQAALAVVVGEPVGTAGAARWLVHARGAGSLDATAAARLLPVVLRWALGHPVARNRTETLELLAGADGTIVEPLLVDVFERRIPVRAVSPADEALLYVFSEPETFYLEDGIPRGTGDAAYAALLLARRGVRTHRDAIRARLDDAGPADFHTLALALEAIDDAEE